MISRETNKTLIHIENTSAIQIDTVTHRKVGIKIIDKVKYTKHESDGVIRWLIKLYVMFLFLPILYILFILLFSKY